MSSKPSHDQNAQNSVGDTWLKAKDLSVQLPCLYPEQWTPQTNLPSFTADDDNLGLGICLGSAGVQCPRHVSFQLLSHSHPSPLWDSMRTTKSLDAQHWLKQPWFINTPSSKNPNHSPREEIELLLCPTHSPSLILCYVYPALVLRYPISTSPFPPFAIMHRYHSLSLWTTPMKYP